METGGSTLARYLDDNGEFQEPDISSVGSGKQGITDPAIPAGTPAAVNQNPYFDPGTNIVPGKDIPLKGTTSAAPTAAAPTSAAGSPESIIDALYQQYGIGDGGRGSGFADRAYWLEHPSEILNGRLAADLAGTGSDQPTGTPGTGPWQNSGRNAATGAAPTSAAAAAPVVANTSGAPIAYNPGAVAPQESEFTKYLRELIKSRLSSASTAVDPNAPNIAAPLTAARDEATRASDKERTDTAERLYAQGGLNTNALNQTIQQSSERNAGSLSTLRGTLIMNAYNQKNQELQSLLQMALASGDAQSARDVQAQIANLNAEIQREGLGVTLAINTANQNANTVGAALG